MKKLYQNLEKIDGFLGAFILDLHGNLVSMYAVGNTALPIKSIASEIKKLLQVKFDVQNKLEWVQLTFKNLKLLVVLDKNQSIVCLVNPFVEIALLRLTVKVALAQNKT